MNDSFTLHTVYLKICHFICICIDWRNPLYISFKSRKFCKFFLQCCQKVKLWIALRILYYRHNSFVFQLEADGCISSSTFFTASLITSTCSCFVFLSSSIFCLLCLACMRSTDLQECWLVQHQKSSLRSTKGADESQKQQPSPQT